MRYKTIKFQDDDKTIEMSKEMVNWVKGITKF
jgi:hypothetical protein